MGKISFRSRGVRMIATLTEKTVTPEELLAMPEAQNFELVDGKLVERNMSVLSTWVEVLVTTALQNYVTQNQLGRVLGSSLGYQCFPDDPKRVRRPDVSFLSKPRLEEQSLDDGFSHTHPDLVVEFVSPNDLYREVEEKVDEYLSAGVSLVWVLNPEQRTVMIFRGDGTTQRLEADEEISGETLVPGFRTSIASFFPPRPTPGM